ncbi:helix-turn-helix domain-containing protein [Solibacillus sp. CAU 1738]|uniref:PucR family transcriptional regulator n=1 Tax=Solibacillus sp. CAU 1738 TaxID=3140363 RepID=UPI00326033E2
MNNLHSLFPSLHLFQQKPLHQPNYFLFYSRTEQNWLQIEKSEVSQRDYEWLQQLFLEDNIVDSPWEQFLFHTGMPPVSKKLRIAQLYSTQPLDLSSLKTAVSAYFNEELVILSISNKSALLIELESALPYSSNDYASFLAALESDFFIRAIVYIGKFHPCNAEFPKKFSLEQAWFEQSSISYTNDRVFTMESLFMTYFSKMLTPTAKQLIHIEIVQKIAHEPELLQTVHSFFEHGFNASATAKALHIHRNTLLYRLNKFQELTALPIRQFDGALLAYLTKFILK